MLESVVRLKRRMTKARERRCVYCQWAVAAHREFSFPTPPLYRYAWTYLGCVALGIYIFAFTHSISSLLPISSRAFVGHERKTRGPRRLGRGLGVAS